MKMILTTVLFLAASSAFAGAHKKFDNAQKKFNQEEFDSTVITDVRKSKAKCVGDLTDPIESEDVMGGEIVAYVSTTDCDCKVEIPISEYWPTYPKHSVSCIKHANQ